MTELKDHLVQAYRRDVMGEKVEVNMPAGTPEMMAQIEAEIAKIDALRLGSNLVNRDFVSYQNRRALLRLREQLKNQIATTTVNG